MRACGRCQMNYPGFVPIWLRGPGLAGSLVVKRRCDQVGRQRRSWIGDRGEDRLAALDPAQPGLLHQPPGLLTAQLPAAPFHRHLHLLDPVDREVLLMDGPELGDEQIVSDRLRRPRSGLGRSIAS